MLTSENYCALFAACGDYSPSITLINEAGNFIATMYRGDSPCQIPMLRLEFDADLQATDMQKASVKLEMSASEAREVAVLLIGFADAKEAETDAIERGYLERGREADDLMAKHYTPHINRLRQTLGGGTNEDVLKRAVSAVCITDRERESAGIGT